MDKLSLEILSTIYPPFKDIILNLARIVYGNYGIKFVVLRGYESYNKKEGLRPTNFGFGVHICILKSPEDLGYLDWEVFALEKLPNNKYKKVIKKNWDLLIQCAINLGLESNIYKNKNTKATLLTIPTIWQSPANNYMLELYEKYGLSTIWDIQNILQIKDTK